MKRCLLITLCVLALLSSTFIALAQQPYTRYCPDPKDDLFTGHIAYEGSKPWIDVIVDPDWEEKFKAERNITGDLPLTPVYDLVVRIKPVFNEYCIPGWVDTGRKIKAEDLPQTVPIQASIIVKDDAVIMPAIASTRIFSRTDKTDIYGRFIYEWNLKGWNKGIAPDKMTLLTSVIGEKPISVLLLVSQPDGSSVKIESPIPFEACTPIWGSGKYKIIGTYSTESVAASERIDHFDKIRYEGFASIQPLASNQSFFSYFVDLKTRTAPTYDNAFEQARKNNTSKAVRTIKNSAVAGMIGSSTCGNDGTLLLTKAKEAIESVGENVDLLGVAVLPRHKGVTGAVLFGDAIPPSVYVHEFGHAFAKLNDEYKYQMDYKLGIGINMILTNCSLNPAQDYLYQNVLYGKTNLLGCSFSYVNPADYGLQEGTIRFFYRPSEVSIMNRLHKSSNFNVVSCGWILAAIRGGDAESYFPECAKMDGVVKDGVQASAFYQLFSALGNLFNMSPRSQTTAVGTSDASSEKEYLIVESFDPNNQWGRIVEVVPDTNSPSTSTTVPSPTPVPPTSNDFVQTENIFDTVSLDVKVNGSDGPVSIQKGGRIVVSWISEGASRCRAMWSKNDIAKSGTIAGRLSKTGSFSIRAACVDAEGNRADDSVVVNVRDFSDLN